MIGPAELVLGWMGRLREWFHRINSKGGKANVTNLGDEYTSSEARSIRIFDRLNQRIGAIIMSAADDALNAVGDQLTKAKTEIDGIIAELEAQGVQPATVERLQALSQSLDDVVPDVPPAG